MEDFKFVKIPNPAHKWAGYDAWVIYDPKRMARPELKGGKKSICPFCPGNERFEDEVFRIGGENNDSNWKVRVVRNKYPFTPIHEVVIHTPSHTKRLDDFSLQEVRFVIETYVNRFNVYRKKGKVCIFCNSGKEAGESISHSHSQVSIVPSDIDIVVPKIEQNPLHREEYFEIKQFNLVCPSYSQWSGEVWAVPKERGRLFGDIRPDEIEELSYILKRIIKIYGVKYGSKFAYNYYIYPYNDWYLRLMPRIIVPGGFEIATGIFVNIQDPKETMSFIKKHFYEDDRKKIRRGI